MCAEEYEFTEGDLNPEFLFTCFVERTKAEQNYHAHDFIEIAVILKGKGRFYIDGKEYDVEQGNMIILNPGMYHRSLGSSDEGSAEFYMAFSGVEFKNCKAGCMPLFPGEKNVSKMPEKMKRDIFKLCTSMKKEWESANPGRYFMLKAYLIQIICLIVREILEEKKGKAGEGCVFKSTGKKYVVEQIMKYMEEHYPEKISLEHIATNMYLSSYYISKIFKSETGDTPINYLISLRMEKAREILDRNPEETVQKVAAAVGYEDAYHFSKAFKKYYGISPLYYKGRAKI